MNKTKIYIKAELGNYLFSEWKNPMNLLTDNSYRCSFILSTNSLNLSFAILFNLIACYRTKQPYFSWFSAQGKRRKRIESLIFIILWHRKRFVLTFLLRLIRLKFFSFFLFVAESLEFNGNGSNIYDQKKNYIKRISFVNTMRGKSSTNKSR